MTPESLRADNVKIGPLRRTNSLADQIHDCLKELVLDGHFALGEWLPMDELANGFGVSRQPVMDAVRRLANDGLIEIVPQVGCRLRNYEQQVMIDYYRLFASCEALIVELAATRCGPAEIAQMRRLSQEIAELALAAENPAKATRYRALNRQLHSLFRNSAQSPAIAEVAERLSDKSDYFVAISGKQIFQRRVEEAHEEHEHIITAIEERDPKTAATLMSEHILAIEARLRTCEI